MKPSDLRIGNIVWTGYNNSDNHPIEAIVTANTIKTWDDLLRSDAKFNPIRPIPLTDERLVRFGFTDGEIFHGGDYYRVSLFPGSSNVWVLQRVWKGKNYGGEPEVRLTLLSDNIKYVHHFQNLIFALTEEELVYKNDLIQNPKP